MSACASPLSSCPNMITTSPVLFANASRAASISLTSRPAFCAASDVAVHVIGKCEDDCVFRAWSDMKKDRRLLAQANGN